MRKFFCRLLCVIVAMVVTLSCSNDGKTGGILEQVPADADLVVVGNVKAIVESAGGSLENSEIKLPQDLIDIMPEGTSLSLRDVNKFLKSSHVDLEACAVFGSYADNQSVVVLALNDKDLFVEAIKSRAYKKIKADGDMDVYAKYVVDGYDYVALNGSYAYLLKDAKATKEFSPTKYLQQVSEGAAKKSFAETSYGKYIAGGNAIGIAASGNADIKQMLQGAGIPSAALSMFDGMICMRGDLSSNKCAVEIKMFDGEGNELKADKVMPFMDNSSTISKKAIAILDEKESVAYAFSLKNVDWNQYIDMVAQASGLSRADRAQLNLVLPYLENIDGTVAIGFGLANGLESVSGMYMGDDLLSQFSATIVLETKEGKAKRLIEDIKGMLEGMSVPFDESGSGISVNLAGLGMAGTLYAQSIDDVLVVANHPINKENKNIFVGDNEFTKSRFAAYGKLAKGDKLASDLKIDNDVTIACYSKPEIMGASMMLEIDGDAEGKAGIIQKLVKLVAKAGGKAS